MTRRSAQEIAADLTPQGIAVNLVQLSHDLDDLVAEYRQLGEEAANAKRDAEVAYAKAYMTAEGTVEERRQAAIAAAVDARYKADLAERKVAACREAIRAVHARIDVGRTLSATTRDEMKLGGVGAA